MGYLEWACPAYACREDVKPSNLQKLQTWLLTPASKSMVACANKERDTIKAAWGSAARGSCLLHYCRSKIQTFVVLSYRDLGVMFTTT